MLHLLTEEHREKVAKEYKKRVTIVFLLGLFVVILVVSAFLIPIYITSHGRYSEVLLRKTILDSQAVKAGDDSSQSVKDMVASLQALHSFDSQKSLSGVVANIVRARPNGIQIKGMVFSPASDSSIVVDIGGLALTRNSLVSFNEKLKQNQVFSQVQVPLSSFAKEKNIDFSMKLLVSSSSVVTLDDSNISTNMATVLASSTATSSPVVTASSTRK